MFHSETVQEDRYSRGSGCEALKNHREEKMGKTSKLGQMSQNLLQNTSLLEIIQCVKYQQNRTCSTSVTFARQGIYTHFRCSLSAIWIPTRFSTDLIFGISLKGTSCHNLFPISFTEHLKPIRIMTTLILSGSYMHHLYVWCFFLGGGGLCSYVCTWRYGDNFCKLVCSWVDLSSCSSNCWV